MRVSALLSLFFVSAAYSQSITILNNHQINAYTPFTHYASAAYCAPDKILGWDCGANCEANAKFHATASGGDGGMVRYWYVGYDPLLKTVILALRLVPGMDGTNVDSLPFQTSINPELFPGIDSSVWVCKGFQDMFAEIATSSLDAVQRTIRSSGASKVTIVGQYLGGALGSLAAVYLPLHLEEGVSISLITYGQPKVGNRAFADYVDAHVNASRITNRRDYIPILPGEILGYHHFSGEIHIQDGGEWAACPGQENHSRGCSAGEVHTVFDGTKEDNDGYYNDIGFGWCDI